MPDAVDKRARRSWWLPPVLALLAVALQFAIDTPHHPMVVHEDPEPPEKTTTAARTPRKQPPKWRARGAAFTQRLRNSWSSRPIADEPIDRRFAEYHEQFLEALARKAEVAAAPNDEPILLSTRVECHTIRCDLELCAPPSLADAVAEQLPRFRVGKRELWHELREIDSESSNDARRTCHRYIVDFAVEGPDARNLRLQP